MTAPIMPRRPLPSISTIVPLVFASLMAFGARAGAQAGAQVANPAPDSGRPALMQSVPVPLAPSKATAASTDPPPVLTLDTAIALALQIGTAVQQGRFASANARSEVTRSYGGMLPSVTASGLRTVTQGDPLLGAKAMVPWNTQFETLGYELQTSLNLLGGISAYPAIRSAQYTRETTDLTLERTRQSVALDVSQAYLQTVLDSQLVDLAAQNIKVSEEQVVQLQELVRVGKRPPADLYQAQSQAAANQSLYFDAVNRQRADEISLLQRIHIDPQRSVIIATPPMDTTLLGPEWRDTAHVATEALQHRPDLQSAHAEIDATRWGMRRAANENMPALSVGFTVYSTGRTFDYASQDGVSQIATPQPVLINQIGPQTSRIFSIGLGYSLYDLFRSRLDYQEARVAYGSAQVAEGDVRRAVTGDVARAISEYGVAVQRMASTASGLASAQAAFQLVSGRYNVGFASIVDFLSAQAALAQAQSLRAQSIVQLSLAKRAIAYAIGLSPTDRLP
jgi:outer membrane protein